MTHPLICCCGSHLWREWSWPLLKPTATVGRRAPTFEIEGGTCRFQCIEGKLAFEVSSDCDERKCKKGKKCTKNNRIKLRLGVGEVGKIVGNAGDSESLSDVTFVTAKILKEGYGYWRH